MPERVFAQTPSNASGASRRPSGNSSSSNPVNSRPSAARTLTNGLGQGASLAEAQKRSRRSNTELRLDDRQLGDLSRDVRDAEAFLNSVRDATTLKAQRVDELRKNRERKAQMDARLSRVRSPHHEEYEDDDATDYTETQSESESADTAQERRDDGGGGGHVVPADDDGDTSTVPSGDAPPPPSGGQFLSRTAVADLAARLRDRQHLMRFGSHEVEGSGFEGRSRSAATLDDDSPPQRPLSGNLDSRRPEPRNERTESRNERIDSRDLHDGMSEASSTYSADIAAKREELMRLQQRRAQELKALRDFREQLERWEQEHPLSDSNTETTGTVTDESSVVKFESPPPRRRGRSREPRIIAASAVNTRSKSEHRSAQKAPVPPPPPPPERFQYGKRATATMPNNLSIGSISNRPPSGQSMTPRRPMVANRGKSPGHLTQPNSVLASSLQQAAEQRKRAMMHQASTGIAAPRRTASGNSANIPPNNLDVVFERPSNTSSSVSSTQFLPPGTQLPSNFNNTRTHAMLAEELVKAPRAPAANPADEWEESTLASVSSAGGLARRQMQRQAEQRNRVMNEMAQANRDNDLLEQDEYQTDSSTSFLTAEALAQLEQHNEAQRKVAPLPLPPRQNSRTPTPPRPLTKPPSPPNQNGVSAEYDSKTDTESALANEVEQLQLLALKLEVQAAENRGLNTDNNRFIADIRQFLRDNGMSDGSLPGSKYPSLQRKNGKPGGRIEVLDHGSLLSRLSASSNPAASPQFIWRSPDGKWHCFSPS